MADGDDDSSQTAPFNRNRQLFLSSSPPMIMFGQFPTRLDMPPNYSFPAVPSSNQNDPPPSSSSSMGLGEFCPEEILLQILCRLPAKRVCRYRSVCRRWKALTSTPYFVELHLKHSCASNLTEVLVERQGYDFSRKFYSFEAWERGFRGARLPIAKFLGGCLGGESDYNAEAPSNKSTRVFMSFSALGFVVLHDEKTRLVPPSSSCCVILNPLTREKVKLIVANEDAGLGGQVYGLFFHPILKQICVLWGQLARLGSATLEFKLLSLASSKSKSNSNSSETLPESSCWRNIIPRLHRHHPRCHSRGVIPPIILGDVLYWMVGNGRYGTDIPSCEEAILAFDIKKEKFELLPHPDPCCPDDNDDEASQDSHGARRNHKWMQLLETNNGLLTLCEFSTSEKLITIWARHSSPNGGIWMRRHMVENYPFSSSLGPDCCSQAIGMVDDELLLVHRLGVGLYVLNLKLGTVQLFETRDGNQPHLFFQAFMCAHSPSLVSITFKKPSEIVVEVPTSIRRLKYREDIIY